jgi:hypothetical protein
VNTQPKYGRFAYITADAQGRLYIIDPNDPAHPKQAATWQVPRTDAGRYLHDIDVQDGLLYASYLNDGLVILDVGNGIKGGSPTNPQLVSQFKYDLVSQRNPAQASGGDRWNAYRVAVEELRVRRRRDSCVRRDEPARIGPPRTRVGESPRD